MHTWLEGLPNKVTGSRCSHKAFPVNYEENAFFFVPKLKYFRAVLSFTKIERENTKLLHALMHALEALKEFMIIPMTLRHQMQS